MLSVNYNKSQLEDWLRFIYFKWHSILFKWKILKENIISFVCERRGGEGRGEERILWIVSGFISYDAHLILKINIWEFFLDISDMRETIKEKLHNSHLRVSACQQRANMGAFFAKIDHFERKCPERQMGCFWHIVQHTLL